MRSFITAVREAGRENEGECSTHLYFGVYLWSKNLDHFGKNIADDGYASGKGALQRVWDSAVAARIARLKAWDDVVMAWERHRGEVEISTLD
ncbi:predicted protein [Sclerotinia sclerotiorum 1980 UF-70]|uniref:Uncharacterized protein n=1 Tax=Sclerotinia sclerotiorum (strain ATCC 18683 / 1980 / Ss-1) TaxID=665079 RepID=A7E4M9_SCLS1|nr:predicted protein [Sclerotinia sclerotiorum 1980 UF-70]EDN90851.1 predicted protein [Sclerotinia sclerotiorum 1980 UF-70]